MRVITWNMGMARPDPRKPGLHDQAWHYLLGLGPDLAFLQEARPPGWARMEGQVVSQPFDRWGSVIFSPRYPLEPVRPAEGSALWRLGAYLAYARAGLPDGTTAFAVSVHARAAPATRRQLGDLDPETIARPSVPRPRVNDLTFHELADLVGERFIAAGDWNTGRTQASATAGEEFFVRAHERGWYDCVWDRFGIEVRTWFREGDALVQDDHVFCDPSLGATVQERPWAAEDAVVRLGLSDHAPLIIDLDVPPIAMMNIAED